MAYNSCRTSTSTTGPSTATILISLLLLLPFFSQMQFTTQTIQHSVRNPVYFMTFFFRSTVFTKFTISHRFCRCSSCYIRNIGTFQCCSFAQLSHAPLGYSWKNLRSCSCSSSGVAVTSGLRLHYVSFHSIIQIVRLFVSSQLASLLPATCLRPSSCQFMSHKQQLCCCYTSRWGRQRLFRP